MGLDKHMVSYEFDGIRDSKRAKAELGELILKKIVIFKESFTMGTDWDVILRLAPESLEEVVERLKPWKVLYRSPTYFCGGTICPMYESAEDELEKSPCKEYTLHNEGKCRCNYK